MNLSQDCCCSKFFSDAFNSETCDWSSAVCFSRDLILAGSVQPANHHTMAVTVIRRCQYTGGSSLKLCADCQYSQVIEEPDVPNEYIGVPQRCVTAKSASLTRSQR